MSTDRPDFILLKRDRDLEGRANDIWVRRGIIALLAVIPLLAAANVFGQRATTSNASVPAATLEVHSPGAVRAGLLFEARFTIHANRSIANAALVLQSTWLEGMTLNTLEPAPESETSQNGSLRLALGKIDAGHTFALILQFQVNPTTVGRRSQDVVLADGDLTLATIHRSITVYP